MACVFGSVPGSGKSLIAKLEFLQLVIGVRVGESYLPAVPVRMFAYSHNGAVPEIHEGVLDLGGLEYDGNLAQGIALCETSEIQILASSPGDIEKSLGQNQVGLAQIESVLEVRTGLNVDLGCVQTGSLALGIEPVEDFVQTGHFLGDIAPDGVGLFLGNAHEKQVKPGAHCLQGSALEH